MWVSKNNIKRDVMFGMRQLWEISLLTFLSSGSTFILMWELCFIMIKHKLWKIWHFQSENSGLKFKIMRERRLVIEHKNWHRQSHASWTQVKVKRSKNVITFKVCFPRFEHGSPRHNSFYRSSWEKLLHSFLPWKELTRWNTPTGVKL